MIVTTTRSAEDHQISDCRNIVNGATINSLPMVSPSGTAVVPG
jgi:uncharacterized protein YbjQ (UPF0145 family)